MKISDILLVVLLSVFVTAMLNMQIFQPNMPSAYASTELQQKQTMSYDQTFVLRAGRTFYYGASGDGETVARQYYLESSKPIDVKVVSSKSQYTLFLDNKAYKEYEACTGTQVLKYSNVCKMNANGGIILHNSGKEDTVVHLQVQN